VAQEMFPRWRASLRALFQGGLWRWALAIGFSVALGGGLWTYDVYGTEIRDSWPRWKAESKPWVRESLLWLEFLTSVTLTIALLCWVSAFLFCLLCVMVFSLPHLLDRVSSRLPSSRRLAQVHRASQTVTQRDRLVGTLLNLLASAGALAVLPVLLGRAPDYWDVGIQAAISIAIELIVLQVLFPGGRLGWPTRKTL
jgi:hypothetical protein